MASYAMCAHLLQQKRIQQLQICLDFSASSWWSLLFWWRLCGPSSVTAFGGPNGIALHGGWRLCGPSSVTAFGGPNGIALHDASGCPSNN
uniref:Uncharacterized protein n=2 Tax=Meloidogyne TaxID=189290 RepID=A0A6V7V9J6_MELEN|nr:unnamed protein product [Meloidogyne enterolobii]